MVDIFGGVDYDKILAMLRLRVYEQSFEDGTSDLTATNCTQTVQDTEVFAGTYSLEVTVSAGQTGYVETPVRPVSANQKVTFSYAHKEDANITSLKLIVVWYRENLHEIDTEEYSLTPSTEWTLDARTVAAPKRAAYMALRIEATAGSSDGHVYLDSITIDLAGQIFRVDGAGNLKVADSDVLEELQTKLDVLLSTRASESTLSAVKTNTDRLDIALSAHRDALKPTRTTPVQELSSQSITGGGIAEFTVDATQTDGFSALVVTVKATYDASATQGVRVRWLYSPDNTNFDSEQDAEAAGNYEDLSFAAGATRVRTILIPLFQPYVKVQIVNLDTTYAVTVDAWRTLMR